MKKSSAAAGLGVGPATPTEPARAGGAVPLRVLPRCTCGESPTLHSGARGAGACLLPDCTCTSYTEATRADP